MAQIPRGIRNHNPGNIRKPKDPWQGLAAQQPDKEFATFEAPKWGIRAILCTLITYQDRHDRNTVEQIIGRWAPPSENNTRAYVEAVARAVGVTPAEVVRDAEPAIPLLRILADAAPWVLGVVILSAIGWIVWARIDDRQKGLR